MHRYTSVLNYYKLYILGWGNNRWLSTRNRDGSRGTSLALESTNSLMSLMRHMKKYNCIEVFNEAYTGNVLTSWIRHIEKILFGIPKQFQVYRSMEWPKIRHYLEFAVFRLCDWWLLYNCIKSYSFMFLFLFYRSVN